MITLVKSEGQIVVGIFVFPIVHGTIYEDERQHICAIFWGIEQEYLGALERAKHAYHHHQFDEVKA